MKRKMKEAIIFIPGNDAKKRGVRLNQIAEDFKEYNNVGKVEVSEDTELYGHTGLALSIHYDNGEKRKADIYEAFWGDLKYEFESLNPMNKPFVGLSTILYWSHPKVWSFAKGDFSKAVFMVSSMLLLVMWYLLVIATFLVFLKNTEITTSVEWIDNPLNGVIDRLPNFNKLLALSVFTSFLPIFQVAGISYNAMLYLKKDEIRNSMRRRVHDIAYDIIHQSDNYDKITILSHSFGSALGAHFVSGMNLSPKKHKFRFITMGAAISFMSYRSDWFKDIVQKCFSNKDVDEWIDFFSNEDWVCSSVKLQDKESEYNHQDQPITGSYISNELRFSNNLIEQFFKASTIHKSYTKNSVVVNTILSNE